MQESHEARAWGGGRERERGEEESGQVSRRQEPSGGSPYMEGFPGRRITLESALWGLEQGLVWEQLDWCSRGRVSQGRNPRINQKAVIGGILVWKEPGVVMDEPTSGDTSVTRFPGSFAGARPGLCFT